MTVTRYDDPRIDVVARARTITRLALDECPYTPLSADERVAMVAFVAGRLGGNPANWSDTRLASSVSHIADTDRQKYNAK
jgi:hypothetical protein